MKRILLSTVIATLFTLAGPARAQVETFSIDPEHSFANWEVRHVAALTSGTFHDVKGKILLDTANLAKSSVEATVSVYSINSSHRRRDIHLLTEEYLNARDYPEMKFVSTSMQPLTAERGTLTGQLTLHGVTRPVTLNYQILGLGNDPWGGIRAGFKATTRILRGDFGILKHVPAGPVGNEVEITLLIEGIKLGPDGQPWNARKAEAEKSKVISYPMPGQPEPQVVPAPAAAPVPAAQPAVTPAAPVPAAQPAPAPAPEKKESLEDQLKKKLKGLFLPGPPGRGWPVRDPAARRPPWHASRTAPLPAVQFVDARLARSGNLDEEVPWRWLNTKIPGRSMFPTGSRSIPRSAASGPTPGPRRRKDRTARSTW